MALCFSEPGGAPAISNANFNRAIEYRSYGVAYKGWGNSWTWSIHRL